MSKYFIIFSRREDTIFHQFWANECESSIISHQRSGDKLEVPLSGVTPPHCHRAIQLYRWKQIFAKFEFAQSRHFQPREGPTRAFFVTLKYSWTFVFSSTGQWPWHGIGFCVPITHSTGGTTHNSSLLSPAEDGSPGTEEEAAVLSWLIPGFQTSLMLIHHRWSTISTLSSMFTLYW